MLQRIGRLCNGERTVDDVYIQADLRVKNFWTDKMRY